MFEYTHKKSFSETMRNLKNSLISCFVISRSSVQLRFPAPEISKGYPPRVTLFFWKNPFWAYFWAYKVKGLYETFRHEKGRKHRPRPDICISCTRIPLL